MEIGQRQYERLRLQLLSGKNQQIYWSYNQPRNIN